MDPKSLIVNVKRTKMVSGENARKVTIKGKFPCAIYKKGCR